MMETYIEQVAGGMVLALGAEIRAVMDDECPGWTMLDMKRCELVRVGPIEILRFDGKPVLEMYPIETEMVRETDRYICRVTRKFRRLGRCQ